MIQKDYRLAAIMYTDIVGFSKMMEKDESGTLRILDIHNTIVEEAIQQNQGTVIKTIGDAYLADFRNTQQALQTALTVQQKLYEYNSGHRDQPLLLRIGIHLGDIYFYENDALGDGINIAARLQGYCRPGCICFSQDVFNQVQNKIEFHAENLGPIALKNISKEIIGYEIVTENCKFNPEHESLRRNTAKENNRQQPHSGAAPAGTPPLNVNDIEQAIKNLAVFVEQKVSGFIDSTDRMNRVSRAPGGDFRSADYAGDGQYRGYRGEPVINGRELAAKIRDSVMNRTGFSGHRRSSALTEKEVFDRYVQKTKQASDAAVSGFIGHAVPFAVVNIALHAFFPNQTFPWQTIVMLGWGIALTTHFFTALNTRRLWSAVKKLPQLGRNALKHFKKWQQGKTSFIQQLAGCISIPPLLFFINRATSTETSGTPWALIPCGILFLTTIIESLRFPIRNARLKKAFLAAAAGSPLPDTANENTEHAPAHESFPLYNESLHIKTEILQLLEKINAEQSDYSELISSALSGSGKTPQDFLEEYTRQIRKTEEDISRIGSVLKTVPLHTILQERKDTEEQLKAESVPEIQKEYERALQEIDRQRQSYKDLANHKQVLSVRLKTAVNSMNKLKLDIMKIAAGAASTEKEDVIHLLENRTNDLRVYIDDLQAGYRETEQAMQ